MIFEIEQRSFPSLRIEIGDQLAISDGIDEIYFPISEITNLSNVILDIANGNSDGGVFDFGHNAFSRIIGWNPQTDTIDITTLSGKYCVCLEHSQANEFVSILKNT